MNIGLFTAFILISFVLVVTPGPIVTLIIATGATRGIRAALTTVGGTTLGNADAAGGDRVRTELGRRPTRPCCSTSCAGAAPRISSGWACRPGGTRQAMRRPLPKGGSVQFLRGALVAISNPKTIAFFTAFLPQFIDPQLPAGRQLAVMCTVTVLLAAIDGFRPGRSPPGSAAPGSCGPRAPDCSVGCREPC